MCKIYLGLAVVLTAGMLCFGQTAGAAKGSASGSSSNSAAAGRAISLDSATNIQAELQKQIDVKKAQPGDTVVLKTTKAVKQNGETVIPKGTNLIGHVTQVSQQGKGNAGSSIGILFDRLEGNGLSSPITASILSITSAQTAANLGDSAIGDVSGSSSTTASGSASTNRSGGGLLGGVGGAVAPVLGTATSAVGGVAGAATQTVGSVASTAGQTVGSATSGLGQTINGIQISNSLSGSASGGTTLSAPGKNLKLEKGVNFQLQLSSQAGN